MRLVTARRRRASRPSRRSCAPVDERVGASAGGTAWPFVRVVNQRDEGPGLRFGVQFRPPAPGAKPTRLTLVEWRTVERDVAFEFRDLPLP